MTKNATNSIAELKAEARKAYEAFVKVKGDLFQQKFLPMTEEEVKLVEKQARFTRHITVPFFGVVSVAAFGWAMYLLYTHDWYIAISVLISSVGLTFFSRYLLLEYRDLLVKKEKLVFTGIITEKKKYKGQQETSYYFTLSEKQKVAVDDETFKKYHLGDIIQYESLSLERWIKNTVTLISRISEHITE